MKQHNLYSIPLTFLLLWVTCFGIISKTNAQNENQEKKAAQTGTPIQDAQFIIAGIKTDETEIVKDDNAIKKNNATIKEINNTPLENDPSVAQQKAAYETAYGAAKSYFQSNNGKYSVGTSDLASVQAQQKTLNAAANKAGAAFKEAQDQLAITRDNQAKKFKEENRLYEEAMNKSISHLKNMLNKLNLLGIMLNQPCLNQIAAGGNLAGSEICLNKIFDNQDKTSRLNDKMDNSQRNPGTNFFNRNGNSGAIVDLTTTTASGTVKSWEGLQVDDIKVDQLKKEAWDAAFISGAKTSQEKYAVYQKYIQEHPISANTQSLYYPQANFQISGKSSTVKQINVPPPVIENTKPTSPLDIFSNSIKETINKMKNYINQSPINVKLPSSVAAVRG